MIECCKFNTNKNLFGPTKVESTYIQHLWKCCRIKHPVHVIDRIKLKYVGIVRIAAQCLNMFLLKKESDNKINNQSVFEEHDIKENKTKKQPSKSRNTFAASAPVLCNFASLEQASEYSL